MTFYAGMTIAQIIHDFATTRGDLTDPRARDDLAAILERRMTDGSGQDGVSCTFCGGIGQVYDGPHIVWRPCHFCRPATPTEETAEVADEDREALAEALWDAMPAHHVGWRGLDDQSKDFYRGNAERLLESCWLRDHDATLTANAKAEVETLQIQRDAEAEQSSYWHTMQERAEAEVDDLRARLGAVEALADELHDDDVEHRLRAAIANPAASQPTHTNEEPKP